MGEFKDMSGALFKNHRKESERHPDYQGTLRIRGEELRVVGWIRTPRGGGERYMSIAVSAPKDRAPADGRPAPAAAPAADDDIPF